MLATLAQRMARFSWTGVAGAARLCRLPGRMAVTQVTSCSGLTTLRRTMLLIGLFSAPQNAAAADQPEGPGDRLAALRRGEAFHTEGWEVFPSASLRGGYDDNITLSSMRPAASPEIEAEGALEARFKTGPYTIVADAGVVRTWYPSAQELDSTEGRIRATVSAELAQLSLRGSVAYVREAERSRNNGLFVDGVFEPYTTRPIIERATAEAGSTYAIGRTTLSADARVSTVGADPLATASGTIVEQSFREGFESEFRARAAYDANPLLDVFADVSANLRRYEDSDADNDIWRSVFGVKFELTRLLHSEVRAGVAVQSFPDGAKASGFVYGASLRWFPDEMLSLALEAEHDFGADVERLGGLTFAVPTAHDAYKLHAEWELLRPLFLVLEASFEDNKRERSTRTEDLLTLSAGATYSLTRNLRLEAQYAYALGTSNFSGNFDRSRVSLGVTTTY